MDECVLQMSVEVKNWFRELGSKHIDQLKWREGFAFISVKGESCIEKQAETITSVVNVT